MAPVKNRNCVGLHFSDAVNVEELFCFGCLLVCAGCDGQKAHLYVAAEVESDGWEPILEKEKLHS